ncbi:MAG TPA: DUF2520 domain-containing protein [Chitinophagaceae bacterium]|nr:DUF2520 domain-containing protein [Chitinophagaceae bacterium]
MKIVIVGSGNIASFFAKKLHIKHKIIQIISKDINHAKQLASQYHCQYANQIEQIHQDTDVIIFALKDDVLLQIANSYSFQDKLIIHTAGSIHLDEIKNISNHIASIWCVYSIQKEMLPLSESVPIVINANTEDSLLNVNVIAQSISQNIFHFNDEQKSFLHLAAVFANNFTNHLYSLSQQICEEQNINFDVLKPLIQNTAEKVKHANPALIQTGPAIRHDQQTMDKHLQLLQTETLKKIYHLLSFSIQQKKEKYRT